MNPVYDPSSFGHSILALVFYLIMLAFMIYSLLALYALLKYGQSKSLGIIVALVYLLIAGGLYAVALTNLNAIKF